MVVPPTGRSLVKIAAATLLGIGIDFSPLDPIRTRVEDAPPLGMDLVKSGTKTIIWATGYRPDYSWLELPVLDRKGAVSHDGGIVCSPGAYLMGMQFLRRRKSALIDGAGDDARDLSAHLAAYLANGAPRRRP
jgi:putative flavoprotein involved in K+ transport